MEPHDDTNSTTLLMVNQVLTTVAGSLSICGTISIFITFALWREMRTSSRRILVFISIGDLLTAIVNVTGVSMTSLHGPLCQVQAFINIAAILSSFFWTVYLSLFLYLSLCGMGSETERRVMIAFHVSAWGIPLVVAVSAAIDNAFGPTTISDGWCWISYQLPSNLLLFWMLFAGKGWEIFSYLAISVFYVKAKLLLKRKFQYPNSSTPFLTTASLLAARKADRKFTFIPVIFILLRLWGTVRFIRYAACLPGCQGVGPAHQYVWLRILHGIGDSSQGFANFVIFCLFTDKIRFKVKCCCSRVCPFVEMPTDDRNYGYESTNTLDGY